MKKATFVTWNEHKINGVKDKCYGVIGEIPKGATSVLVRRILTEHKSQSVNLKNGNASIAYSLAVSPKKVDVNNLREMSLDEKDFYDGKIVRPSGRGSSVEELRMSGVK